MKRYIRSDALVSDVSITQAISELSTYIGTDFEQAAERAIRLLDEHKIYLSTHLSELLNVFDYYYQVNEKLYEETGLAFEPTFGLDNGYPNLVLGLGKSSSADLSKQFDFTQRLDFNSLYRRWYKITIVDGYIPMLKKKMKEFYNETFSSFDDCLTELIDSVLPKFCNVEDSEKTRNFLTHELLNTYRRSCKVR